MDWTALENRLAQAIGLESSHSDRPCSGRPSTAACGPEKSQTLPRVHRAPRSESVEFQALVEELVVRESWFFRHAHAFELLRRHAASTIAERRRALPCLELSLCRWRRALLDRHVSREAGSTSINFKSMPRTSAKWPYRKHATASTVCAASASWLRRFRIDISAFTSDSVEVLPEIRQAVRFTQANIVEAQSVLTWQYL